MSSFAELRIPAVLVVVVVVAAACSAEGPGDARTYTKIDDMEGEGIAMAWAAPEAFRPIWVSATDCTQADRIAPPPSFVAWGDWTYAELPSAHATMPGVISTQGSRLRTTSPITGIWGANMNLLFAAGPVDEPAGDACARSEALRFAPAEGVDLRAYTGITFWAMAPSGRKVLRVQLVDRNTHPLGGICNAANPQAHADCYNGFQSELTLTAVPRRYTVDFASLTQQPDWGFHPDPNVPDLEHVFNLAFEVDVPHCGAGAGIMCAGGNMPEVSFDLWIDDLYFVNR